MSVTRSDLTVDDARDWALAEEAVAIVAHKVRETQGYWCGPGRAIPFNKADLLPIEDMNSSPRGAVAGWRSEVPSVDVNRGSYLAYWADRAWSSLHPASNDRTRRLFEGELQEILERAHVQGGPSADEVTVFRYDMFLEGAPHLRGMIRNRQVEGVETVISETEDAINPNFHAGPPLRIALDPPA